MDLVADVTTMLSELATDKTGVVWAVNLLIHFH